MALSEIGLAIHAPQRTDQGWSELLHRSAQCTPTSEPERASHFQMTKPSQLVHVPNHNRLWTHRASLWERTVPDTNPLTHSVDAIRNTPAL